MTFPILLIVLLLPMAAKAESCSDQAQAAFARGEHHLVISMEGLLGGFDGRAARYARQTLADAGREGTVVPFSHIQSSSAARCAAAWKAVHGNSLRVTFVGHSFGGGLGAFPAIEAMGRSGITIQNLIVFDGRMGNEMVCGAFGGPTFRRPANVEHVTNFYQCGAGLPGRTFVEDGHVDNIRLPAAMFGHVNLPSNRYARGVGANLFARRVPALNPTYTPVAATPKYRAPSRIPATRASISPRYIPRNKDNQPAKCFRFGATIPCTYKQATEEARIESAR